MKQKMTKLFCLLAAFTLTISMTACGNPGSESQTDPAADDGTVDLTIGLTSLGSETLDYSIPSGYTNENISRLLYTDYIVRDENGEYDPALGTAESWSHNEDSTEWTLTLKQGVLWHDGTEMTSEDIVFGVERMKRPELSAVVTVGPFYDALESCTAVDTYTAKFVFKQGFPLFEYYMHFVPAMPKAYIESAGEEAFNNAPVGNGPCKFVSHELGSSVEFEAFEDYFLGKPSFDKLTLRIIPEASTLVAALKNGEIDMATGIPYTFVADLESDSNITLDSVDTGAQAVFVFADRLDPDSPLSDVRVREALNLSIDREGISIALYNGMAEPAYPFPDSEAALGMPDGIEPLAYDPERAKELLAEAGYPDGFELTIHCTSSSGSVVGIAESAQAMATNLESIGIKTELILQDSGEYMSSYIDENFDGIAGFGTSPNAFDIGTSAYLWAADGDGLSWMVDEDTSDLWNKQVSEGDPELREQYIEEAVQIMIDDVRFMPLVRVPTVYGYRSPIVSYEKTPTQTVFTDGIMSLQVE